MHKSAHALTHAWSRCRYVSRSYDCLSIFWKHNFADTKSFASSAYKSTWKLIERLSNSAQIASRDGHDRWSSRIYTVAIYEGFIRCPVIFRLKHMPYLVDFADTKSFASSAYKSTWKLIERLSNSAHWKIASRDGHDRWRSCILYGRILQSMKVSSRALLFFA
jgi:hypothetical protein